MNYFPAVLFSGLNVRMYRATVYSIHSLGRESGEFVSRNRCTVSPREERKSAREKRHETRHDATVSWHSRSRWRSRSTRKGRGGLLPIRGRQSGFPLGNARVKWLRSLGRNACVRTRCETMELCRYAGRRAGFRDYSFDSSKKKRAARNFSRLMRFHGNRAR